MIPASTQPASESALAGPHREIVKRAGLFAALPPGSPSCGCQQQP